MELGVIGVNPPPLKRRNRNGICRTLYRLPATGTACTSALVVRCTPRLVTVFSSQYGCPGPANDPKPLTTYCGR